MKDGCQSEYTGRGGGHNSKRATKSGSNALLEASANADGNGIQNTATREQDDNEAGQEIFNAHKDNCCYKSGAYTGKVRAQLSRKNRLKIFPLADLGMASIN